MRIQGYETLFSNEYSKLLRLQGSELNSIQSLQIIKNWKSLLRRMSLKMPAEHVSAKLYNRNSYPGVRGKKLGVQGWSAEGDKFFMTPFCYIGIPNPNLEERGGVVVEALSFRGCAGKKGQGSEQLLYLILIFIPYPSQKEHERCCLLLFNLIRHYELVIFVCSVQIFPS